MPLSDRSCMHGNGARMRVRAVHACDGRLLPYIDTAECMTTPMTSKCIAWWWESGVRRGAGRGQTATECCMELVAHAETTHALSRPMPAHYRHNNSAAYTCVSKWGLVQVYVVLEPGCMESLWLAQQPGLLAQPVSSCVQLC